MFGLGYQELLIILVIVLLLFGAQKLPELARGLGATGCAVVDSDLRSITPAWLDRVH